MIVQGEVRSKGVKDHQNGRRHPEPVLCQCQDRIGGRPEEQVQGCPLVLVHDRTKIMRQCEHEMEVRDPGDHFRLPEGSPLLFIQVSAAGTVAVSAGTGTHFGASAGITADQRISQGKEDVKKSRRICRLRPSSWMYSFSTLSVSSGDMAFHAFGKRGSQVLREIGIIEGVFNVFPFPEPCIELHVDQCTGDRAVAEPLLYLEQVGTGLVVVKRMSMPEGVETVSPFVPAQFMETVFEHLLESAFADMGTRSLAWEKPVIRLCAAAALFPVLPKDVPEPYRKLDFAGVTALAHFFRDRDRAVGKREYRRQRQVQPDASGSLYRGSDA